MASILIIGQGNIGTFVGAALQQAGHTVKHYIRAFATPRDSVELRFMDRRRKHKLKKGTTYNYVYVKDQKELRTFDFVFISVGPDAVRPVLEELQPLTKAAPVYIIASNVWGDFDWMREHMMNPFVFAFPNFGGAIVDGTLKGWLTGNFTTGILFKEYNPQLRAWTELVEAAGFRARPQADIEGWLRTHYAYMGGMMLEAARSGGFRKMTKRLGRLARMFRTQREFMQVVRGLGTDISQFKEGRRPFRPVWMMVILTFLLFLLPGLARSVDILRDDEVWTGYARTLYPEAKAAGIPMPITAAFLEE